MYHNWLKGNANIHQGRLLSEEAMVKMIGWEVQKRVEYSSYCNPVNGPCLCKLTMLEFLLCNVLLLLDILLCNVFMV